MRDLHCRISDGLWQALHARAEASGEPVRHSWPLRWPTSRVDPAIFQVWTSGALVRASMARCGSARGERRPRARHVRGSRRRDGRRRRRLLPVRGDGSSIPSTTTCPPLRQITRFAPDRTATIGCPDFDSFAPPWHGLRDSEQPVLRAPRDSTFEASSPGGVQGPGGHAARHGSRAPARIRLRSASPGPCVGFWTPGYAESIQRPWLWLPFPLRRSPPMAGTCSTAAGALCGCKCSARARSSPCRSVSCLTTASIPARRSIFANGRRE